MLPFAILMVVFFVFGVPLFLSILLVRHRNVIKKLGRDIDEALAEAAVLEQLGESIDVRSSHSMFDPCFNPSISLSLSCTLGRSKGTEG